MVAGFLHFGHVTSFLVFKSISKSELQAVQKHLFLLWTIIFAGSIFLILPFISSPFILDSISIIFLVRFSCIFLKLVDEILFSKVVYGNSSIYLDSVIFSLHRYLSMIFFEPSSKFMYDISSFISLVDQEFFV